MNFEKKVSDYLNKWAEQLKAAKRSHFRVTAVKKAAAVVLTVPLEPLIKANSLKSIKGIGEDIEKVILEIHFTGKCAEIDNGTSGAKVAEPTPVANPNIKTFPGQWFNEGADGCEGMKFEGRQNFEFANWGTEALWSAWPMEQDGWKNPKGLKDDEYYVVSVDTTGTGWEFQDDEQASDDPYGGIVSCSVTYRKMTADEKNHYTTKADEAFKEIETRATAQPAHANSNIIELCGVYEGDDKIECLDMATKRQTSCIYVDESHPPKGMKEGDAFYIYVDTTGKEFDWMIDENGSNESEQKCSFTYKKMPRKEYEKIYSDFIGGLDLKEAPLFYWHHSKKQTKLLKGMAGNNPVIVVTPASHFERENCLSDGYCENERDTFELNSTYKVLKNLGFDVDISGCEGNRAIYYNGDEKKMLEVLNNLPSDITERNAKFGKFLESCYKEEEEQN